MVWTSSGSRFSDMVVKPETSANRTVTLFRSPSRAPPGGEDLLREVPGRIHLWRGVLEGRPRLGRGGPGGGGRDAGAAARPVPHSPQTWVAGFGSAGRATVGSRARTRHRTSGSTGSRPGSGDRTSRAGRALPIAYRGHGTAPDPFTLSTIKGRSSDEWQSALLARPSRTLEARRRGVSLPIRTTGAPRAEAEHPRCHRLLPCEPIGLTCSGHRPPGHAIRRCRVPGRPHRRRHAGELPATTTSSAVVLIVIG